MPKATFGEGLCCDPKWAYSLCYWCLWSLLFFFNKHQIPVYFKLKQSPTKKNSNSPQRRNAIPKTFSVSGSSFSLVLIFRFRFNVSSRQNLNMFHIYGWTEGQGNKWSHAGGRLLWDIHTDKHIKANAAPELSALISWYPWQQHIHSCIRSHPLSQVSLSLPLSHTHTGTHFVQIKYVQLQNRRRVWEQKQKNENGKTCM